MHEFITWINIGDGINNGSIEVPDTGNIDRSNCIFFGNAGCFPGSQFGVRRCGCGSVYLCLYLKYGNHRQYQGSTKP